MAAPLDAADPIRTLAAASVANANALLGRTRETLTRPPPFSSSPVSPPPSVVVTGYVSGFSRRIARVSIGDPSMTMDVSLLCLARPKSMFTVSTCSGGVGPQVRAIRPARPVRGCERQRRRRASYCPRDVIEYHGRSTLGDMRTRRQDCAPWRGSVVSRGRRSHNRIRSGAGQGGQPDATRS